MSADYGISIVRFLKIYAEGAVSAGKMCFCTGFTYNADLYAILYSILDVNLILFNNILDILTNICFCSG